MGLNYDEFVYLDDLLEEAASDAYARISSDPEKYEKEYMLAWMLRKKIRLLVENQTFAANNQDNV